MNLVLQMRKVRLGGEERAAPVVQLVREGDGCEVGLSGSAAWTVLARLVCRKHLSEGLVGGGNERSFGRRWVPSVVASAILLSFSGASRG